MSTDVIGSRYCLESVVTCTPEATTWDARDTWLDERVLVVTPEPGCDERFAALAGAVLDRSSSHLVGLYDIGARTDDFVVFGVPAATLSDERAPREEEDVLLAGRALGDALETLHERGIVHGDLHPGSVVLAGSGEPALSPWPLAPRPHNWSGPGGFGTDPDEARTVSTRDDLRALGALLLGALAGPPVLSSEQVANIATRTGRARAECGDHRRPRAHAAGGWRLRRGSRAPRRLRSRPGGPAGRGHRRSDLPAAGIATAAAGAQAEAPEGRRAALVLAASGAALFAGFGIAGSIGVGPHAPARPVTTHASGCVVRPGSSRCGPDRASSVAPTAASAGGVTAQLADHRVAASSAAAAGARATASTTTPSTSATAARPAGSTTTSPPSTTTSSSPSTTTTAPPATTTSAPVTTTTAPPSTTTSTSSNAVQAGPSSGSDLWSGPGPGDGPGQGQGH